MSVERLRAAVYIDGYNFYFGRIRNSPHRWLNVEAFADRLLPDDDVVTVKYFTARVGSHKWDPGQANRQSVYLRALATLPRVVVIPGHFRSDRKWLRQSDDMASHHVRLSCEKRSDVNLAVHLVRDAFRGDLDVALVVSNDSDLVGAIDIVRADTGLRVGVANTQQQRGRQISGAASFLVEIREHMLAGAHLPPMVHAGKTELHRPRAWDPNVWVPRSWPARLRPGGSAGRPQT